MKPQRCVKNGIDRQNIRYDLRGLAKHPRFTATVVNPGARSRQSLNTSQQFERRPSIWHCQNQSERHEVVDLLDLRIRYFAALPLTQLLPELFFGLMPTLHAAKPDLITGKCRSIIASGPCRSSAGELGRKAVTMIKRDSAHACSMKHQLVDQPLWPINLTIPRAA